MAKRATNGLTTARLKDLARRGAELALKELRAEIVAIERTFPELALPASRRPLGRSAEEATSRTRRMSAAARRAVSQRMKKYWAERRKAKARIN
jgi:hypothetical protein